MSRTYRPAPIQEEEEEPLTGHNYGDEKLGVDWRITRKSLKQRLSRLNSNWLWVAQIVLFSISMTFFAASLCLRSAKKIAPEPMTWSPINEAVKYEIKHFDLPPIPEGRYVGKGPEVDAAWSYLTDGVPDTMVSREEMIKMGHDPNGALEITDPATGKRGYRVATEVFHQLHCLNLIRQNNYKKHYAALGGDTSAEPMDLHGHIDHCIDALRQFIMCKSDVNVFPFRFPFNDGDPWPDYSGPHMCRNYDRVRRWAVDHGVAQGPDEPDH